MRLVLIVLLFVLPGTSVVLQAQPWEGIDAPPGRRSTGWLPVPDGADGRDVRLPVTVIRGNEDGPTVAILAGIHGVEYVPIVALHSLAARIDPQQVRGTIVLVHIANPPAFQRRTIFYGPNDWKNLNRVFPGKADGSQSERIAHVLTTHIIDRVDAMIDVHCGDGNEDLTPYVSFFADAPDTEVVARSRSMALAFGSPVVKVNRDPSRNPNATRYTTNAAAARGVAAIGVELGGLGRVEREEVETVQNGLLNVLRQLRSLREAPLAVAKPMFMTQSQSVASPANGLWFPAVRAGQPIAKDSVIGTIRDPFGAMLAEVRSPLTGYVVYVTTTPPTNAGETLASIGVAAESDAAPRD